MLHMVVVRSPYAHARIKDINLEEARVLPGVVAAFSGAELVRSMPTLELITSLLGLKVPKRRPLALDRVRYVGDPVAVVLAEDRYIAEDARDLVEVDYEVLPAVIDPEAALAPDTPLLYEELGSNIAIQILSGGGDIEAALVSTTPISPNRTERMLNGPYQIQALDFQAVDVFTNTMPTAAYRGAGRPEAASLVERTMEAIAQESPLDPAGVRRRNLIAAQTFALPGSQSEVQMNDTALPAYSIGTFGSRPVQRGAAVVLLAAQAAGSTTGGGDSSRPGNDRRTGEGTRSARASDAPGRTGRQVEEQPDLIEHDPPHPVTGPPIAGLTAWPEFSASGPTFSSGAHVAVV